jgi:hypothetical protein
VGGRRDHTVYHKPSSMRAGQRCQAFENLHVPEGKRPCGHLLEANSGSTQETFGEYFTSA